MKRCAAILALILVVLSLLTGCSASSETDSTRKDIDFTVVEQRKIPQELQEIIEENKEDEIRMAYEDGEDLYLIREYGEQKTGGYSIAVKECSEDEKTILLDTQLLGPESQEEISKDPSYPYLVVKMEKREKEVQIK